METRIAENIRAYRKQRGLTQEQLAEVLGVSVGAVYKWESRSSLPELRLIMEMADFFDVSVDALLGYKMKDNQLNATVERLRQASRSRDYDTLSEAEKAIMKYPHPCWRKQEYKSMRGGGSNTVLSEWVTKLDQARYSQNTIHTTYNDMMEEPC